jgi:hypothetical protein
MPSTEKKKNAVEPFERIIVTKDLQEISQTQALMHTTQALSPLICTFSPDSVGFM